MDWAAFEYRRHFDGAAAYCIACCFFVLVGCFFWNDFFLLQVASLRDFFELTSVLLVPTAPAMTMALLAEDTRTGEVWQRIGMGVSSGTIVLTKYLAALGFLIFLLCCSLAYPVSVAALGNIDTGPVVTGYLGLLLQGGTMLAFGLLASSLTQNQLVAFFTSGVVCFAFWSASRFLPFLPPELASIVEWVSFESHFSALCSGVVDTRDVVYFVSLIVVSLLLATLSLDRQARGAIDTDSIKTLAIASLAIAVNVAGLFYHSRLDATRDERFSLSETSRRLAPNLKDRMEVVAYFSADLPPPHNTTERYVRDLLMEYRDAAKGKLTVRFVNPSKDEDRQAAERDSVVRVQDQKLEADSYSVQEGYRGLAFHYLGDTRAIPQVDDTDGLEYQITQIIKELSGEKVGIGVVVGKNPSATQSGPRVDALKSYLPAYDVQDVKLDEEVPPDLKALLIVQPEMPFTDTELRYLNQFVMRGGSLGVFGGSFKVELTGAAPTGAPVDSRLNELLEKWGLKLEDQIVADAQCGRARMPTQLGIPIAVPYPPVPVISFDEVQSKHPVLFRLEQSPLPYSAAITLEDTLENDKAVKRTVLAKTTKAAWLMHGSPVDLKARERWDVPEYSGPFVVGVALEGRLPSAYAAAAAGTPQAGDSSAAPSDIEAPDRAEKSAHVLVLGTGYFLRDEFLPRSHAARQAPGGAAGLALNAIDWLAQDSDLIAIRTKSVGDASLEVPHTVKEAEAEIRDAIDQQDSEKADKAFQERKQGMAAWDEKKNTYRWGNTLGLPLLFGFLMLLSRGGTRLRL